MTHTKRRLDAVPLRDGRYYVPTIYGETEGNTIWIKTWQEFRDAGGTVHYNEDATEITLTIPAGHKFSTGFNRS